jgi:hypothetical protein
MKYRTPFVTVALSIFALPAFAQSSISTRMERQSCNDSGGWVTFKGQDGNTSKVLCIASCRPGEAPYGGFANLIKRNAEGESQFGTPALAVDPDYRPIPLNVWYVVAPSNPDDAENNHAKNYSQAWVTIFCGPN